MLVIQYITPNPSRERHARMTHNQFLSFYRRLGNRLSCPSGMFLDEANVNVVYCTLSVNRCKYILPGFKMSAGSQLNKTKLVRLIRPFKTQAKLIQCYQN